MFSMFLMFWSQALWSFNLLSLLLLFYSTVLYNHCYIFVTSVVLQQLLPWSLGVWLKNQSSVVIAKRYWQELFCFPFVTWPLKRNCDLRVKTVGHISIMRFACLGIGDCWQVTALASPHPSVKGEQGLQDNVTPRVASLYFLWRALDSLESRQYREGWCVVLGKVWLCFLSKSRCHVPYPVIFAHCYTEEFLGLQ